MQPPTPAQVLLNFLCSFLSGFTKFGGGGVRNWRRQEEFLSQIGNAPLIRLESLFFLNDL